MSWREGAGEEGAGEAPPTIELRQKKTSRPATGYYETGHRSSSPIQRARDQINVCHAL
jgi:hypothetical protein